MDSDQQSFITARESFQRILSSWWWILAFMLLGALGGWIFTRLQPVMYEARASINFRVDFVRTGAISDVREDALLSWPEDIFYSTEVVDQVISFASQRGSTITPQLFREMSSLERQNTRWAMVVRSQSADEAEMMVNDWAVASESVIKDALAHSVVVDLLRRYQDGLVSCLEQTSLVTACPFSSIADLQDELSQSTARIENEEKSARGASSAIQMVGIQASEGPPKPVLYIHNQVILAGALLGGLIGIVFIETKGSIRRRSARIAK
jgi:hypothetical protein